MKDPLGAYHLWRGYSAQPPDFDLMKHLSGGLWSGGVGAESEPETELKLKLELKLQLLD